MTKKQMKPQAYGSEKSYCQVSNVSNDEATIFIYDVIGGWGIWAVDFIYMLSRITAKTIRVRVHCDGGWVTEAIAMHNALRKHPAHIIMEVDSIAASAATFFIQAGDERVIAENAQLMFHDVQGGVCGTEDQIRAYADYIPQVREAIISTYDYRTNITADEARELLTRGVDVYLSATEALEMGFVDRIEKLADMGEPPANFNSNKEEDRTFNGPGKNFAASLNELKSIYGLINQSNNSADSGRQDKGTKGENMSQKQLIAQLMETGVDVAGLQATALTVKAVTDERDTAKTDLVTLQGKHDALTKVTGDRSPEQVAAIIATADTFKSSLVDNIVAHKRLANQCGDSKDEVTLEKETLNCLNIEQLQRQEKNLMSANKGKDISQLISEGDKGEGHKEINEVDDLADNIVKLSSRSSKKK